MFTKFTQYITIIQYDPWTYPIQFLLFIVIAKDVKVFIQRKLNKRKVIQHKYVKQTCSMGTFTQFYTFFDLIPLYINIFSLIKLDLPGAHTCVRTKKFLKVHCTLILCTRIAVQYRLRSCIKLNCLLKLQVRKKLQVTSSDLIRSSGFWETSNIRNYQTFHI